MNTSAVAECVFCELREKNDRPIVARSRSFFAVNDKYPVNIGHTLIIPFRHVSRLRDLTVDEFAELKEILELVQDQLTGQLRDSILV